MDPAQAVGHKFAPEPVAYNRRDLILYALGLGVTDEEYAFENHPEFGALPTYPLVLRLKGESGDLKPFGSQSTFKDIPGMPPNLPLNQMLHGEQSLELLQPLPVDAPPGLLHLDIAITGVYDKGTQMQIVRESVLKDVDGTEYCKMVNSLSVIGMGGFGGDAGPQIVKWRHPAREADVRLVHGTFGWQNLLYRLSGDANPVHASPEVARKSGWHAPTFQGMATFAIAGCELAKHFGGSPDCLKSINARFVQPVFPGETLEVIAWDVSDNRQRAEGVASLLFQVRCQERDIVVLSNGVCQLERVGKAGHFSKL